MTFKDDMPNQPDTDPRHDSRPAPYPGHRVLAIFPFYNEAPKLETMGPRLRSGLVDMFLGVDNGSSDGGADILRRQGLSVISQPVHGVGSSIRKGIEYARRNGYDIVVVMAGNDKDDPEEIPALLEPILRNRADYVQGSRFLKGGSSPNLPVFRWAAIKLLSVLFRLYSNSDCTDLTNGFRAYKTGILNNPGINIGQAWLNTYELEYYIHWKAYALGYRIVEVPVTKTYPHTRDTAYTKIQPFVGWWKMLRPFVLLALRIKE